MRVDVRGWLATGGLGGAGGVVARWEVGGATVASGKVWRGCLAVVAGAGGRGKEEVLRAGAAVQKGWLATAV